MEALAPRNLSRSNSSTAEAGAAASTSATAAGSIPAAAARVLHRLETGSQLLTARSALLDQKLQDMMRDDASTS